ncbi:MAG: hypothetical protein SF123_09670 [Chloroflexota bacterium]|nr:hypothetical protein [Chloroflexota bacterium]
MLRSVDKLVFVVVLLSLLLVGAAVVSAQAVTPEPAPSVPVADVPGAAADGLDLIARWANPFTLMAGVVALTQILKNFAFLKSVDPRYISLVLGVILWIGSGAAQHFGVLGQFNSALDLFNRVLPIAGELILVLIGSPALYQAGKWANVPFLRPRTDPKPAYS